MTACTCEPRVARFGGAVINGVRIDDVGARALVDWIRTAVGCGQPHIVRFYSTDPLVLARRDPLYRDLLNDAALGVFDGVGPVLAARVLAGRRVHRLTGTDALMASLADTRAPRIRHYFFGASRATVDALSRRVVSEVGEDALAGVESPPFHPLSDAEWQAAVDRIRAVSADVVWVGLGTPKQDYAATRLAELRAAPVIACVGAAFDFYAGTKARAPKAIRAAGGEWMFRLLQEPHRLWRRYLIGNALFAADLVSDLAHRMPSSRERVAP